MAHPRDILLRPLLPLIPATLVLLAACGGRPRQAAVFTIQVKGSDTMVNAAQAWAEQYKTVDPAVNVEVSGGGSGVGIAALIKGTIDIATASRDMKPSELEQARKNTGREAKEFVAGFDALAVCVHKDNPISSISLEQIAGMYEEDGAITRWSQIGITIPGVKNDEIILVNRQSSSGTYEFFREKCLHNRDFRLGSLDMNGSKEAIELIGSTKAAIGYSGMGYATGVIKMLPVAAAAAEAAVAPTMQNTLNKSYVLARSLHLYTIGEPEGVVRKFIDWILSEAGQSILADNGYVPVAAAAETTPSPQAP